MPARRENKAHQRARAATRRNTTRKRDKQQSEKRVARHEEGNVKNVGETWVGDNQVRVDEESRREKQKGDGGEWEGSSWLQRIQNQVPDRLTPAQESAQLNARN